MIDCLLIGHNEISIGGYEKQLAGFGQSSEMYRELNLNFVRINNQAHTFQDIFNRIYAGPDVPPFSMTETFSNALAYLGSYLVKHGFTFDYVNSFNHERDVLIRKLKTGNYRTVGITTTLYVSPEPLIEVVQLVRSVNDRIPIVVGGPFVYHQSCSLSEKACECLFRDFIQADIYIRSNQGEATLVSLLSVMKAGSGLHTVPNIYYRANGALRYSFDQREDNSLGDNLVDWSLFGGNGYRHLHVRTSVSCPFHCSFCACPDHQGKYQKVNPDLFQKELRGIMAFAGLESVYFIDDTLNFPATKFKDFLKLLIREQIGFKWHSYFRCQFADEEMVALMKQAGCQGVYLGIESGNNTILSNMNKHATVEQYRKGIDLLKKYGILSHGSFIIGFPGETEETVEETRRFITESGIDFYRAQLWFYDPLTPVARLSEKFGLKGSNFRWSHHTMDSKTACDHLERLFTVIREPLSIPTYNFDFHSMLHLHYKGIEWEKLKGTLAAFNDAIRRKLADPSAPDPAIDDFTSKG